MTAVRHPWFRKKLPVCALAFAASVPTLFAAQTKPQEQGTATTTLHVYVNLIQVPVLVLDAHRHTKPPIPPSRFTVSIGGLPAFHPRHVRREGDDPIALTLLVDASTPYGSLWRNLPKSLGPLVESLHPGDTIDLYAMDGCSLRHIGSEAPPSIALLQKRMSDAVAIPPYALIHRQAGPCQNQFSLWNAMGYITMHPGDHNGRRVLLMVTDGQSPTEKASMMKLGELMASRGIATFAIADEMSISGITQQIYNGHSEFRSNAPVFSHPVTDTDVLAQECEMSGGMLLPSTSHGLAKVLAHTIELVRNRYIVEFPRPDALGAGLYQIDVSVGDAYAFVRPGGASARLADATEKPDSTVEHGVLIPETDGGVPPANDAPPEQP